MKKMQRRVSKNLIISIVLILTLFHNLNAQTSDFRLQTADSLFHTQRFTQSFEHYSDLLEAKQYSPAMLLKMAYIQEGLGDIGNAMYYLNLYFLATNDKAAYEKMEQLAEKFNLEGYRSTDGERFLIFYHDHYQYISIALAALIILMLSAMFYTKVRLQQRPVVTGIFFFVFLSMLFVHTQFGGRVDRGILTHNTTYIMQGPSAGAPVLTVTSGGHRVEVVGKKDVWLKIIWAGQTGFVRDHSLLPIEL
ncbi:MAG TPA: SH3 domain-containing protein [Chryseosolibacter sp.]|nr:SH3 domain-containing protein [Chryseosolibacter sp.]